jgi:hypothetical protein
LLRDELQELLVFHLLAASVKHVEPSVGHSSDRGIALNEAGTLQKSAPLEHLRLEHLDELELTATLHLETLQLSERSIVLEDGIPLL